MTTASAANFRRIRNGYDPIAVDEYISQLTGRQQSLINDVQALQARLERSTEEAAALREEVAVLKDTSPSAQAITHRMAKMLQIAVDEVSEMQSEARTQAADVIAAANTEAETTRKKNKQQLTDMAAQRSAFESEREQAEHELDRELTKLRVEAKSANDEQRQIAQQACEKLLSDAKDQAEFHLTQARHTLEEMTQQRINILEHLMTVYRRLENVPAILESAYREKDDPSKVTIALPSNGVADHRAITG